MEQNQTGSSGGNPSDDIQKFFKEDLKNMFMAFFTNPMEGHHENFKKSSEKATLQAGIIMGSVFVVFFLCFIIMMGTSMMSMLFKISLAPVIMMGLISSFSFGIKSISGKPDFKQEMLTGGLCGIPLAMGIILATILKFAKIDMTGGSIVGMIIILYLLLMMIGVFQQSLKAAGSKDTLAWFASPAAILLAGYVTYKAMYGMM